MLCESRNFLFPFSSAGSGHRPDFCHLLYDIKMGSLTKRNNTCTVSAGGRAGEGRIGVVREKRE